MEFDQDVCGCQLLYHNCCGQDYPLWYLIKMFMAVSYYIITTAVRIILYGMLSICVALMVII